MLVAEADVFYVSTNGDNGNIGSEASPWRNITYAASSSSGVSVGDTIMIRAGNYPEAVSPSISGSAVQPIVIMNYPGETVNMDPGRFRFNPGVNYWKLDGLHILRSTDNGVYCPSGTHPVGWLTVTNCEISYHKENGVCLIGPDFGGVTIEDCVIERNGEVNGVPQWSEGTGICMYGVTGKIWARRNWIALNWAKGISHGSEADWQTDSSIVDSNHIIDNYESGIDWWGDNSFIRYNYMSLNGTRDTEGGEWGDKGMALNNNASGNMVAFNVIKSSGRNELDPRGYNNIFYNNTFIKDHYYNTVPGSPYAATILMYANNGSGNEYRNNIIVNYCSEIGHHYLIVAENYSRYTEQIWSNNLYWAPNATAPPGEPWKSKPFLLYYAPESSYKTFDELRSTWPDQEVNSLWGDPEFVSLPDSILSLLMGSPAVNAGINVGFPYSGTAPEMGRYEIDEGNTPPWIDPPLLDFITEEDTQFVYDLTPHENDAEQSGSELTWTISGLDPSLATGSIERATDRLTITPVANQYGSDSVTLTLSDGQGGIANQVVNLIINEVNDIPWIDPTVQDIITDEDVVFTYDLTPHENDLEQSHEQLVWTISDLDPLLASASIDLLTDLLTITPIANQSGSDDFTLTLSDGRGGQDTQVVMLTVNPVNDPPWIDPAVPDLITEEDNILIYDLSQHENDIEQLPDQLSWTHADLDPLLAEVAIDPLTDLITITPLLNASGDDVFTLFLSDAVGGLDSQSVVLTVGEVNDPPEIDPLIPECEMKEDEPFVIDLTEYENDVEDTLQGLYWTFEGVNTGLITVEVDPVTDTLRITPALNLSGADTLLLILHDSGGETDMQDWIVNVVAVNDTPWIAPPIANQSVQSYFPYTLSLLNYGNDIEDPVDSLNWEISNVDPALFSADIDPVTKLLTMHPVVGTAGSDVVILTVIDTKDAPASQDVTFDLFGSGSPTPPGISGLEDIYEPQGSIVEPLNLADYVALGTTPFPELIFTPSVWDAAIPGSGNPLLIVYIEEAYLHIEAPAPDWQGSNLVAVRIEDTFGFSDEDTLKVTLSHVQAGSNLPEPDVVQDWYIVEPDQTVHAENFNLHVANLILEPEFVSFQQKGGQIVDWLNAAGTEVFIFPLVANEQNLLQLRVQYENLQYSESKSIIVIEDSTPPAPPSGLSMRREEEEIPQKSVGND